MQECPKLCSSGKFLHSWKLIGPHFEGPVSRLSNVEIYRGVVTTREPGTVENEENVEVVEPVKTGPKNDPLNSVWVAQWSFSE